MNHRWMVVVVVGVRIIIIIRQDVNRVVRDGIIVMRGLLVMQRVMGKRQVKIIVTIRMMDDGQNDLRGRMIYIGILFRRFLMLD